MFDIKVVKALIKGILTFIPGISGKLEEKKVSSRHSGANADFCYALWMRLLWNFHENGIKPEFKNIGELGCGGSVGVGICALLCGVEKYSALEIENRFDVNNNLRLLEDLKHLLRHETVIPSKFPQLNISSGSNEFPRDLIKAKYNDDILLEKVSEEISTFCEQTELLQVIYDWNLKLLPKFDLIFSRAVLEHVKDPKHIYTDATKILNPGGYMFHDIELHSHGVTRDATGHLLIPSIVWRLISGKRKYFMNRYRIEDHIALLENNNFTIIDVRLTKEKSGDRIINKVVGATILAKYRGDDC
jgi:SAM-dependent methyltransferase